MVPTLTPAFIIPEGIGGGISGGGGSVATTAAGVVAAGVIAGGLAVVAAPVVGALAAKAAVLTTAGGPGLLAIGAFLKGLEQLRDWGLLNFRPAGTVSNLEPGEVFPLNTVVDAPITLTWDIRDQHTAYFNCQGGLNSAARVDVIANNQSALLSGVAVEMGATSRTTTLQCAPGGAFTGPTKQGPKVRRANGTTAVFFTVPSDGLAASQGFNGSTTRVYQNIRVTFGGVQQALVKANQGQFAPGTRPQLSPQTLPDAPPLPAPPLREPLQTPTLPPPPDRRPLAPPVTIPRPGQQPARVPVPGPRPGPTPGPGPSPTPSQPAPAGVPAVGPLPLPIPLPVPTTPGSVVIVDGQPIGGPGQAPAPNLTAIATELGRLERKNEILLSRPENGGAGPLLDNAILNTLRTALERLITELLNDVPSGSFTLSHACPPPGGGDPLPPVVVPYDGGGNPTAGILAKLDGLAGLIQAHKTMGQPTCKTAISGEEVTIHFESDG